MASEAELHAQILELTRELSSERTARQASERALIEAVDFEQQRLAQLLHETLSQSLSAARLYGRVTRNAIHQGSPEASATLLTLDEIIQSAADEVRSLTRWLRPARLGNSDLITCLADLSQLASRTGPCELRCAETSIDADAESQAVVLRVAQLALHACVRCCQTKAINLTLELDERHLILAMQPSCDHPLPKELEALLHRRARAMGGACTVQQEPKRGYVLICKMPRRR